MPATVPVDRPAAHRPLYGSRGRRSVKAEPGGPVRIFDRDPEFRSALSGLPTDGARTARELLASSWQLKSGRWDPEDNPPLGEWDCGYFVLEGLLLSQIRVGSRCSAELLGAGDIFRADDPDTRGYATLASQGSFRVLAPARIAVLESGLVARIESVPGIASLFQRRLTQRARSLSVRLAIVQVPQLTRRLHLLLWHLADRFGRRHPEGTLIPFPLSHEVLAECVSARRTSVLAAIHELKREGAVEGNEDGHWLLHAEPPGELA